MASAAASELGLSRTVPVLIHGDAAVPATMGVWRPVIVLPPEAPQWHPDDLRRVLIHELEHVRRGDWWIHLVARGICIAYWFHPLAWLAWRQLTVLAERACDDAVVARTDRADYAEQLVALATRLSGRPRLMLAMAGRSALSARVRAILNPAQQRGRAGAGAVGVIAGIAILALGVVASLGAVAPRTVADDDQTIKQPIDPETPPVPSAAIQRPVERQTPGGPSRERTGSGSTSTRARSGAPPRPAQRASPVSPTSTAADPATAPYVIGADDVLRFSVWGNPDLSDEVLVRPDGKISLPLIGDVQAAGLTPEQLRQTVTTGLERLVTNPAVTIQVTATNSRQVYAVGQVARPGVYQLTGSMTVLQLLAAAGGMTDFARKSAVVITRQLDGKSINIPFDYAAFVSGEQLDQNIMLMPGDVVVVR
jgi:polysaccharide export outer membrane protein